MVFLTMFQKYVKNPLIYFFYILIKYSIWFSQKESCIWLYVDFNAHISSCNFEVFFCKFTFFYRISKVDIIPGCWGSRNVSVNVFFLWKYLFFHRKFSGLFAFDFMFFDCISNIYVTSLWKKYNWIKLRFFLRTEQVVLFW